MRMLWLRFKQMSIDIIPYRNITRCSTLSNGYIIDSIEAAPSLALKLLDNTKHTEFWELC